MDDHPPIRVGIRAMIERTRDICVVGEDVIAAIWWAEYNTIVEEKQMGAISVYALPKTIWDTQRGGPEAGIWRRGPNDFGIRIELDPELIGPIVITIPRAELRKIK